MNNFISSDNSKIEIAMGLAYASPSVKQQINEIFANQEEDWPYRVDVLEFGKYTDIIPMRQWCRETLNEGEWVAIAQYCAFKTEEALVWFKLRWL
jgi:hypothetical protein